MTSAARMRAPRLMMSQHGSKIGGGYAVSLAAGATAAATQCDGGVRANPL